MCTHYSATLTTTDRCVGTTGRQNNLRRKLWELEERFHCSVIGTCLSLDELRQICCKAQVSFIDPPTDHELHSAFVNMAGESVFATRLMHKQLDSKYRHIIRRFKRASDLQQLATLWDQSLDSGEVAGAFWALVTHEVVSSELLNRVYGEIHMLSHLAGASIRMDMQALVTLRQRVKTLETQRTQAAQESQRHLQVRGDKIRALGEQLKQAEQVKETLRIAEQKLAELTDSDTLRKRLQVLSEQLMQVRAEQSQIEQEGHEWQRRGNRAESRNQRLESSLAAAQRERDALEISLASALSGDCQSVCTGRDGDCRNLDLCGRSILYVGGRTSQNSHFRDLVERANGHFMYHDGGREDGHCHLAAVLQKADVVLCPLDCVSHSAVERVKRFCKRNHKTLMLLPRSSLSAFSLGLTEVVA
ncbi:DUF2325 domain-containing protein [Beggiatoa alba]|nr:DUF2325 domain-containing protein [Beggiatoa alba]